MRVFLIYPFDFSDCDCAIGLSINPFKIFQHVFLSFQLKTFGKWVFGFIKDNMIGEGFFFNGLAPGSGERALWGEVV